MKFGPVTLDEAAGAILAHGLRLNHGVLRKGTRLGGGELAKLRESGVGEVTVARLEPGDIDEDRAAGIIAEALCGEGLTVGPAETGRANLIAASSGLVSFAPDAVDALNAVDEAVTLATIPPLAPVAAGRMVATVKIIPFAVESETLRQCLARADAARLRLHPFRPMRAQLIQTVDGGPKASVLAKTAQVTADRLARLGGGLAGETQCPHRMGELAAAMQDALSRDCDILLVVGASAIVDRRDVIPAALEAVGGRVERLGMPVDPGNLILLGAAGETPVLGLPGCARSPARNGLDWVLERLAAGVPVDSARVAGMGVGGLLVGREEEKDYV